ncbi:hypothetical protein NONI108955_41890 [Nocardia ninae]|uniref:Uncharacterized protein n=1 Tax=Nocardia ninae NBRC 108245 TaxID=1210091 RepID=A0A511MT11_9NOCA|nr:hypothetical protein [Nocardia ninae]GEM43719.1 hypothetical protein NN4_82380 [Nocardia ninae NBRC 108245]
MTTIHDVRAVEQTMPARASTLGEVLRDTSKPVTLGDVVRAAEPYAGHEKVLTALQGRAAGTTAIEARADVVGVPADDLTARLVAANERAAQLEQQLAALTAERDAAEHKVAELADRNRELASDLDDALDLASERALSEGRERLVPQPIYGHAFAGLVNNHDREGIER